MPEQLDSQIRESPLRGTVQITLPDGKTLEGPRGAVLENFLVGHVKTEAPIVGGIVNGEIRELTYPIDFESSVCPVTMADADGMRIYRRSLTFLLAAAFEGLFPQSQLYIYHSVSSGGYFCQVSGMPDVEKSIFSRLEARMRELIQADLPFTKEIVPLEKAIEYCREKGYTDKVRLLTHRRKPNLVFYQLGELSQYHHGYMVPRTGYLRWFRITPTGDGFTLSFPRRNRPTHLQSPPKYPKLLATFRQYGDWLRTLGISSVGALNDAIVEGRARELILVVEALQERRITEIAAQIAKRHDYARLVLIAGPSASGKTTFSKRLSIQLLALGISPVPIEMDNFFVDRDKTPRDESGEFDFEALQALDLERLNHDLQCLINGERILLPHYDFKAGLQEDGETTQLAADQIIILEGIHGLDPALLPKISTKKIFRIYVSALTQLNLDRYNRVSTTDTRLIRRIVRDATHRGYSARETIQRWESVRRGEKRYIFPFQENADVFFNSALAYEGSALASLAEPLLRQVPFGTDEYIEAKRLLTFLEWFIPLDTNLIPDNSILREFFGGSILREFTPWQPLNYLKNGRFHIEFS